MSGYVIELRDDIGGMPLSIRVPPDHDARDAALKLALAVLVTLKHHVPSNGHTITLRVTP